MTSPDDDAERVRATLQRWIAGFNVCDVDALSALYDPEAVYAGAHSPRIEGAENVLESMKQAYPGEPRHTKFVEETIFVGVDLALLAGRFQFNTIEADGSLTPTGTGRAHLLFRRGPSGEWRMVYDTDNNPPDLSDDDFADV